MVDNKALLPLQAEAGLMNALFLFLLLFHERFVGNSKTNLHWYFKEGRLPKGLTVEVLFSLSNEVKHENG